MCIFLLCFLPSGSQRPQTLEPLLIVPWSVSPCLDSSSFLWALIKPCGHWLYATHPADYNYLFTCLWLLFHWGVFRTNAQRVYIVAWREPAKLPWWKDSSGSPALISSVRSVSGGEFTVSAFQSLPFYHPLLFFEKILWRRQKIKSFIILFSQNSWTKSEGTAQAKAL